MQIAPRTRIFPGVVARTRCAISVAASIAALSACGGSSPEEPSAAAAADPASAASAAATGGRVQAEAAASKADAASAARPALPNLLPSFNDSGFAATFSLAGVIDRTGLFFQSLGSNGRSCASCHVQQDKRAVAASRAARIFACRR